MTDDPFGQPVVATATPPSDAAYSVDGTPDRYGRYKLPHPETGKVSPFTRATTFAKSISDTYTLSMWSQRMAIKGVAMRPDLLAGVAATPVEEREKLNKLAEAAKETAGAKAGANLGTAVHSFSEHFDKTGENIAPAPWNADIIAYGEALNRAGITIDPELIERTVVCEEFGGIAGTFDRLVFWNGRWVIFDLKTGKDLEYGWMEIVIQLAIYSRAKKWFDKARKVWNPMPDVDQNVALVMHLPVGKATATLYEIDIATGWEMAKLCYAVRNARKTRGLAKALTVVEAGVIEMGATDSGADDAILKVTAERIRADVIPAGTIVVAHDPEILEEVKRARTIEDLFALRRKGLIAKTWTPLVQRAAEARRDAIYADTAAG